MMGGVWVTAEISNIQLERMPPTLEGAQARRTLRGPVTTTTASTNAAALDTSVALTPARALPSGDVRSLLIAFLNSHLGLGLAHSLGLDLGSILPSPPLHPTEAPESTVSGGGSGSGTSPQRQLVMKEAPHAPAGDDVNPEANNEGSGEMVGLGAYRRTPRAPPTVKTSNNKKDLEEENLPGDKGELGADGDAKEAVDPAAKKDEKTHKMTFEEWLAYQWDALEVLVATAKEKSRLAREELKKPPPDNETLEQRLVKRWQLIARQLEASRRATKVAQRAEDGLYKIAWAFYQQDCAGAATAMGAQDADLLEQCVEVRRRQRQSAQDVRDARARQEDADARLREQQEQQAKKDRMKKLKKEQMAIQKEMRELGHRPRRRRRGGRRHHRH